MKFYFKIGVFVSFGYNFEKCTLLVFKGVGAL